MSSALWQSAFEQSACENVVPEPDCILIRASRVLAAKESGKLCTLSSLILWHSKRGC